MNTARQHIPLDKPDIIQTVEAAGVVLHRNKGLCPLHQEKTPSFVVYPTKQRFRCYGCGASGDSIDFIRQFYGLSYGDALKRLGIDRGEPYQADPIIERRKKLRAAFETWRRKYYIALADEAIRLNELRILAEKKPPQGEVGWAYAEAIARLPEVDHKLDVLFENDPEDHFRLYCEVNQ